MKSTLRLLRSMKTEEERIGHLQRYFPCLLIYYFKMTNKEKLVNYMNQNMGHINASQRGYSFYVHGHFIPWLDQ